MFVGDELFFAERADRLPCSMHGAAVCEYHLFCLLSVLIHVCSGFDIVCRHPNIVDKRILYEPDPMLCSLEW